MSLKGIGDIETYNKEDPSEQDNVVIDSVVNLDSKQTIKVKTGCGDDVIQINGIIGKPESDKYFSDLRILDSYGLDVKAGADDTSTTTKKENNVLSFEGMPSKKTNVLGVTFHFGNDSLMYRIGSKASPRAVLCGVIKGIKMLVGSPFDDIVNITNEQRCVVHQSKGKNQ